MCDGASPEIQFFVPRALFSVEKKSASMEKQLLQDGRTFRERSIAETCRIPVLVRASVPKGPISMFEA